MPRSSTEQLDNQQSFSGDSDPSIELIMAIDDIMRGATIDPQIGHQTRIVPEATTTWQANATPPPNQRLSNHLVSPRNALKVVAGLGASAGVFALGLPSANAAEAHHYTPTAAIATTQPNTLRITIPKTVEAERGTHQSLTGEHDRTVNDVVASDSQSASATLMSEVRPMTASATPEAPKDHSGDTVSAITSRHGPENAAMLVANLKFQNPKNVFKDGEMRVPNGRYQVKPGDTLLGIAEKFDTTPAALMALTPEIKNANLIYVKEEIVLGSPKDNAPGVIIIENGDTFWGIAQTDHTTPAVLEALNPRDDPTDLTIGQTMITSDSPHAPAVTAVTNVAPGTTVYGLSRTIGAEQGISPAAAEREIFADNGGKDPLYHGTRIVLPETTTTAVAIKSESKPGKLPKKDADPTSTSTETPGSLPSEIRPEAVASASPAPETNPKPKPRARRKPVKKPVATTTPPPNDPHHPSSPPAHKTSRAHHEPEHAHKPAPVEDVIRRILKHGLGNKIDTVGIAGIEGNMYEESGLDAGRLQYSASGSLTSLFALTPEQLSNPYLGMGLVQEDPPSKLLDAAKAMHEDPNLIETQVKVLMAELNQPDIKNPGYTYLQSLAAAKTAEEAAVIFMTHFERPGVDNGEAVRISAAQALYKHFVYGTPIPKDVMTINPVSHDQIVPAPPQKPAVAVTVKSSGVVDPASIIGEDVSSTSTAAPTPNTSPIPTTTPESIKSRMEWAQRQIVDVRVQQAIAWAKAGSDYPAAEQQESHDPDANPTDCYWFIKTIYSDLFNMPYTWTGNEMSYMGANPTQWQPVTNLGNTSDLLPGDVFVVSGIGVDGQPVGHTIFYSGAMGIAANGNDALSASLGGHEPEPLQLSELAMTNGQYSQDGVAFQIFRPLPNVLTSNTTENAIKAPINLLSRPVRMIGKPITADISKAEGVSAAEVPLHTERMNQIHSALQAEKQRRQLDAIAAARKAAVAERIARESMRGAMWSNTLSPSH